MFYSGQGVIYIKNNMNRILLAFLVFIPNCIYAQNRVEIIGYAQNIKDGTTITFSQVLPKFSEASKKEVGTNVKNQQFYLSVMAESSEQYYIKIFNERHFLFLDKGTTEISIEDSLGKKIIVKNNKSNTNYYQFVAQKDTLERSEYGKALNAYDNYVVNKNKDEKLKTQILVNIAQKKKNYEAQEVKNGIHWINKNPNLQINTYILYHLLEMMPDKQIKDLFKQMPAELKSNSWAKIITYKVDSLFVGGIAPNFKQADTTGKQFSLSDFKGKYILLDFWATWCQPCRVENPNLVKVQRALLNNPFVIISVSLDKATEKDQWRKIIKADKMNWINLSTLNGFENEAALKYHIKSIPSNFLISPNGTIVARDLRGNELINKLKEIFSLKDLKKLE